MGYAGLGSVLCSILLAGLYISYLPPVNGRSLPPKNSNDVQQNMIDFHQPEFNSSGHKSHHKLPPAYRQTLKRLLKMLMKNGTLQLPAGFNLSNMTSLANITAALRDGRQFGGGNGGDNSALLALLLLDDDGDGGGWGGGDDHDHDGYDDHGGSGGGGMGGGGGGDMSQMLPFLLLGLALLAQSPTQG